MPFMHNTPSSISPSAQSITEITKKKTTKAKPVVVNPYEVTR